RIQSTVDKVNALEEEMTKLSDEELKNKTTELKNRYKNAETLEDLTSEAYAVVREASKRVMNIRPLDVQIMCGGAMNEGNIAEMKTGEGKILASALPAYLNSLTEKGVHINTVNEYLAERDSNDMRPLYDVLDLTVGYYTYGVSSEEKREAYECDITY